MTAADDLTKRYAAITQSDNERNAADVLIPFFGLGSWDSSPAFLPLVATCSKMSGFIIRYGSEP